MRWQLRSGPNSQPCRVHCRLPLAGSRRPSDSGASRWGQRSSNARQERLGACHLRSHGLAGGGCCSLHPAGVCSRRQCDQHKLVPCPLLTTRPGSGPVQRWPWGDLGAGRTRGPAGAPGDGFAEAGTQCLLYYIAAYLCMCEKHASLPAGLPPLIPTRGNHCCCQLKAPASGAAAAVACMAARAGGASGGSW